MQEDSYPNVSIRHNVPVFILNIDLPIEKLEIQIKARGIRTKQILEELPAQFTGYKSAMLEIKPDWTLNDNTNEQAIDSLIEYFRGLQSS